LPPHPPRSTLFPYTTLFRSFRFLRHDRVLRTITLSWLAIVFGLGMTMVADVPLVNLFGTGSFGYGVLIACWGGGSIVGSLIGRKDRKSTRLNSSHLGISYAV